MISEIKIFEKISSGGSPYIVDYYCALQSSRDANALYICMELMDISVKRFYEIMHDLNTTKTHEIEQFLKRVIHDVIRRAYFFFTGKFCSFLGCFWIIRFSNQRNYPSRYKTRKFTRQ